MEFTTDNQAPLFVKSSDVASHQGLLQPENPKKDDTSEGNGDDDGNGGLLLEDDNSVSDDDILPNFLKD